MTFTFHNVQPGKYAISSMHDLNENFQMDFQDNGIPKEAYTMSGSNLFTGPPSFKDAAFDVKKEDLELSLQF